MRLFYGSLFKVWNLRYKKRFSKIQTWMLLAMQYSLQSVLMQLTSSHPTFKTTNKRTSSTKTRFWTIQVFLWTLIHCIKCLHNQTEVETTTTTTKTGVETIIIMEEAKTNVVEVSMHVEMVANQLPHVTSNVSIVTKKDTMLAIVSKNNAMKPSNSCMRYNKLYKQATVKWTMFLVLHRCLQQQNRTW